MAALYERIFWRLRRVLFGVHAWKRSRYVERVRGRRGIEIGGPSTLFGRGNPLDLYHEVASVDNCNFSSSTVWAEQDAEFRFDPEKAPGRCYFCEGSDLAEVPDASYDFVLSSHNLEHFANPGKALREWHRVLRPGGSLVLALPDSRYNFDHRRSPTPAEHMLDDYTRNTGEDDLTHVEEILEKHDLALDPAAGTPEQFRARSLDNLKYRCLHHHVFDKQNVHTLLDALGFKVLTMEQYGPGHLFVLAEAQPGT